MRPEAGNKLADRICLITGAGSGVGRAMANLFAANGATVVAVDVVQERIDQAVAEIRAAGGRAGGRVFDLSRKESNETMVDETVRDHGRIDVLCNNAGIMDRATPVAETTDELWERVINVNLNAAFWASRRAIPFMLKQESGSIVNTSSVAGLFGGRAGAAYTTSKHALIGLTRSIAAEYGARGVRCNAMVLGAVKTAIGIGGEPNALGMAVLQKTMATLSRVGEPEEVAKLALFLASEDSSFINGACMVIDAGWSAV